LDGSSKRLVYFQSHGQLTDTIPAGVLDDAGDGDDISQSSETVNPSTDPLSHTPVTWLYYTSYRGPSAA